MRLINEDAVMEIIERVTNEAVEKKQPKYLIQPRIIAEISGLPTIEAEPVKHGWWIIDYAEGTKIYHAHCSECNKEPDRNIGGDYYIDKLSDFCPNCGAKLIKDGDSE